MKKILSLLMLLLAFSATAQTEVGKVAPLGSFAISIQKFDTYYLFKFKDSRYTTKTEIVECKLEGNEADLQKLYDQIVEKFETKSTGEFDMKFGDEDVKLNFEKNMGVMSLQFQKYIAKDIDAKVTQTSTYLTRKQVDKLFGKK